MSSDLAHAWRINCNMNHLLLEAIPDASLGDRYSPRTRSVAAQFAHMHNVRVSHLKKRFREVQTEALAFARGAEPAREALLEAFEESDRAVAKALAQCELAGKARSWKGPPASVLSYFVAHEAHHRGLAMVCLRVSGTRLPKDFGYGLWYWSRDWAADWDSSWEDES